MATSSNDILINVDVKGADTAERQLDGVTDATEEATEATNDYSDGLSSAAGDLEIFGTSLNGLKSGFMSSIATLRKVVVSLKTLKGALISTGIGAIIVLLGSLAAWFSSTSAGATLLSKGMASLGAVVDVVLGRISMLTTSIGKLLSGDFTGALNEFKGIWSGIGDEIKEAVNQATRLVDLRRELEVLEASGSIVTANANKVIAEQKRIAEDTTKTFKERIEASKQAELQLKALNEFELSVQKQRQEAAKLAFESEVIGSEKRREAYFEYQQLLAEGIEAEAQRIERSIELQNKTNGLFKEQQAGIVEAQRLQKLGNDELTQSFVDNETLKTKVVISEAAKRLAAEQQEQTKQHKLNAESLKLREQQIDEGTQFAIQGAKDVTGALVESGKDQQIIISFLALIQALLAFNNQLSKGDPYTAFARAGAALAAGLGVVSSIKSASTSGSSVGTPTQRRTSNVAPTVGTSSFAPDFNTQGLQAEQATQSRQVVLVTEDLETIVNRVDVRDSLTTF